MTTSDIVSEIKVWKVSASISLSTGPGGIDAMASAGRDDPATEAASAAVPGPTISLKRSRAVSAEARAGETMPRFEAAEEPRRANDVLAEKSKALTSER